jgi:hypothetical protein
MLIDLIDIIQETIDNIDTNLVFKVEDNELITCDTKWIKVCDILTIGSEDYEVISFEHNEKIVLDRTVTDSDITSITINNPKFRHGTVSRVNDELIEDLDKKPIENYPLVFLLEELEIDYNINQIPYANSVVKLFFICQTNYEDYSTSEHHKKTIQPLKGLVCSFLESLKKNSHIVGELVGEFTTNLHPLMAYTNREGYEVNLFNDDLSAIQLTINLPINKINKCCKN